MTTDLEGAVGRELARLSASEKACEGEMASWADRARAHDKDRRTILDALASITRERDAMREAHRPYAAVSAKAKGKDDDCWCGQDGAVIRYRDLRLSAALVNGEVGE